MSKGIYTQAYLTPDNGFLKGSDHEWDCLQNFGGYGNKIVRRKGVRNSVIMTSGVMGIHDLLVDNDPTSLDRIVVTLHDGSIVLLTNDEIFVAFTYLFTGTATLVLQSPDNNYWNVTPDSNGLISPTVVATPVTTISSDLNLGAGDLFGFSTGSVIYGLSVDTFGIVNLETYNLTASETEYATTQAFTKLVGPVFTDSDLTRYRLSVDNSGSLLTTVI